MLKKVKDRDHFNSRALAQRTATFFIITTVLLTLAAFYCGDVHVYAKYDHQPFTTEIVKRTQINLKNTKYALKNFSDYFIGLKRYL